MLGGGGMDIKRQVINTPYIVYPKIYLFSRILAQNSEEKKCCTLCNHAKLLGENYL